MIDSNDKFYSVFNFLFPKMHGRGDKFYQLPPGKENTAHVDQYRFY